MDNKPAAAAETTAVDKVFNRFDENGDGKISAAELGKVVRALGPEVSESEVEEMIQEMDSNRDGFVDKAEFAEFNESVGDDDSEMKAAFDMYDLNRNGLISAKEMQLVLQKLGEDRSVEECARMIKSGDSDGDGCVDFEEFKATMRGGGMKNEQAN